MHEAGVKTITVRSSYEPTCACVKLTSKQLQFEVGTSPHVQMCEADVKTKMIPNTSPNPSLFSMYGKFDPKLLIENSEQKMCEH